ncbi:MAG: putative membrane protein [Candidatus Tokpelaia sp. JSC085]|nr:MAG: putative membrane protein [Candidatus Tokpelaia sp. JSC085]
MVESNSFLTTSRIWTEFIVVVLATVGIMSLAVLWLPFQAYSWIKAVHVIAIISWMAGLLYLPRLFVYHCAVEKDSIQYATFKTMEQRLLRYIIHPGMLLSWTTGFWMTWKMYHFQGGWLYLKLSAAFLLSVFHGLLVCATCHFIDGCNRPSQRIWRFLNEVPTLLMIIAVIAVIIKIPE